MTNTLKQNIITAYKGFACDRNAIYYDKLADSFAQNTFSATSVIGSFGSGLYLGDKECAKAYASDNDGLVFEVTVSPSNLLVIHTSDDLIEQFETDTYALPLISFVMDCSMQEALSYFKSYCVDDFYLGAHITSKIIEKGYDAVQVIYNGQPHVFEIIVLNPQVVLSVNRIS